MVSLIDRVQGMFYGHALGDALGAPHEFRSSHALVYTGKLIHPMRYLSRHVPEEVFPPGSTTDDTAMTITLLESILRMGGKYCREDVILSYINWANATRWLGNNTRALFKGIKTVAGFEKRHLKIATQSEKCCSNGSLMRALPLALISNLEVASYDAWLSNPNDVNIEANMVYITAVQAALAGLSKEQIWERIVSLPLESPPIQEVLHQISFRQDRNVVIKKGYVAHALWCALRGLYYFDDYTTAINWIVTFQPGSDTDTNAAITGGLLGAYYGYSVLMETQEENLLIMSRCGGIFSRYIELLPALYQFFT